jgi:toxin CcdB
VHYPYVIVLQHDRVSSFATIVVAPLVRATSVQGQTRLHPSIDVDGVTYAMFVEDLAAVPRCTLGRVVGSAETNRYEILAAIDMLFTGI